MPKSPMRCKRQMYLGRVASNLIGAAQNIDELNTVFDRAKAVVDTVWDDGNCSCPSCCARIRHGFERVGRL